MQYTLRFSLRISFYLIMLPFLVPVLLTFYRQDELKFECKTPVPNGYPARNVRSIYRTGELLPSRCCVLYIYFTTNISTKYF
jgi:hypothetical protein